ncbi:unnamed protein product [Porites lobata]|uniref:Uncharacterized protein n=1 Tax=Porites lobata TaxID=104759 RepID=A0ABN8P8V7_9CNID|nr:unnamed protein product [Porites lobata]
MYQEFTLRRRPPIYDPKEFQIFCRSAGAPTIFDTILNAMTDLRHSQLRLGTNEKRTVAIIYKLCYGVSQVCNWLQTDHVLFLKESNLNQRVFEAQREMGNSCCRRRVNILHAELAESNTNKIGELISEAIKEQWQLVLIIDHYTSVHSKRRPKTMPSQEYVHNNITSCVKTLSSSSSMYKLAFTYSSAMPAWIRDTFFNPELERHRLAVHEYNENDSVRTMRQMTEVHLLQFIELTLKSKKDFSASYDIVLSTRMSDYFKNFL